MAARNFGKNCRCADADLAKKAYLLRTHRWDLMFWISIAYIGGKLCLYTNITVNTANTNLTEW